MSRKRPRPRDIFRENRSDLSLYDEEDLRSVSSTTQYHFSEKNNRSREIRHRDNSESSRRSHSHYSKDVLPDLYDDCEPDRPSRDYRSSRRTVKDRSRTPIYERHNSPERRDNSGIKLKLNIKTKSLTSKTHNVPKHDDHQNNDGNDQRNTDGNDQRNTDGNDQRNTDGNDKRNTDKNDKRNTDANDKRNTEANDKHNTDGNDHRNTDCNDQSHDDRMDDVQIIEENPSQCVIVEDDDLNPIDNDNNDKNNRPNKNYFVPPENSLMQHPEQPVSQQYENFPPNNVPAPYIPNDMYHAENPGFPVNVIEEPPYGIYENPNVPLNHETYPTPDGEYCYYEGNEPHQYLYPSQEANFNQPELLAPQGMDMNHMEWISSEPHPQLYPRFGVRPPIFGRFPMRSPHPRFIRPPMPRYRPQLNPNFEPEAHFQQIQQLHPPQQFDSEVQFNPPYCEPQYESYQELENFDQENFENPVIDIDEAVQNELKQQNESLATQRFEYYKKCTDLYEKLDSLKAEKENLLKQKRNSRTDMLLKENSNSQNDIHNKLKAVKNVIEMLTKIIGDGDNKSDLSSHNPTSNIIINTDSEKEIRKTHRNSGSPRRDHKDNKERFEDAENKCDDFDGIKDMANIPCISRRWDVKNSFEGTEKHNILPDTPSFGMSASGGSKFESNLASSGSNEGQGVGFQNMAGTFLESKNNSLVELVPQNEGALVEPASSGTGNNTHGFDKVRHDSIEIKNAAEEKNYVYYDPEVHWCQVCDLFPRTAKDFLNHLHCPEHKDLVKKKNLVDFPWHKDTDPKPAPNNPDAPTERVPIRGLQFFIPVTAWYCKLCDEWIGDLHCASAHLKSKVHRNNYHCHMEKNPYWEVDWMATRMRAYENYLDAKASKERKLAVKHLGKGVNEKPPKDPEKTKHKSDEKDVANCRTEEKTRNSEKVANCRTEEKTRNSEKHKLEHGSKDILKNKSEHCGRDKLKMDDKLKDPVKLKYLKDSLKYNLEDKSKNDKCRSEDRNTEPREYKKYKQDDVKKNKNDSTDYRKRSTGDTPDSDDNGNVEQADKILREWMEPVNKNVDKELTDLKNKLKKKESDKEYERLSESRKKQHRELRSSRERSSEQAGSKATTDRKRTDSPSSESNKKSKTGSKVVTDIKLPEEKDSKPITQKCKFPFIGKMPFSKGLKRNRVIPSNIKAEQMKMSELANATSGEEISKIFEGSPDGNCAENENVVLDNDTRKQDFEETLNILFPGASNGNEPPSTKIPLETQTVPGPLDVKSQDNPVPFSTNDQNEIPLPSGNSSVNLIPRPENLMPRPDNLMPRPENLMPQPENLIPPYKFGEGPLYLNTPPGINVLPPMNLPPPNVMHLRPRIIPMPNTVQRPHTIAMPTVPIPIPIPVPAPKMTAQSSPNDQPLAFLGTQGDVSNEPCSDGESNTPEHKKKKNPMSQRKRKRLQMLKEKLAEREKELQLRIDETRRKLEIYESAALQGNTESENNNNNNNNNENMELALLGIDAEDSAFQSFTL